MPYNDAPTEIHMLITNTGMYRYVPVCTCMYEYVRVCTVMYQYVLVCNSMYLYVPDRQRIADTCPLNQTC